jgi:hypothetical protein
MYEYIIFLPYSPLRPVETAPGMGVEGIKENDGRGEFNNDIIVRTLVDIAMYPQNNNFIYTLVSLSKEN